MSIISFYAFNLAEIEATFTKRTGLNLSTVDDIFIENKLPYDGWYVRLIY